MDSKWTRNDEIEVINYNFQVVNKTGDALHEEYMNLLPLGYTQRYTIKVGEENESIEGVGLFDEHPNNDQFEVNINVDTPMIAPQLTF